VTIRYVKHSLVLLEVGRANVGDARRRPTAPELLRGWNARLKGSGVRFVGSVGHTGNYMAEANDRTTANTLSALLKVTLDIRVAVFVATEFLQVTTAAQSALAFSPAAPSGRRLTAGLVMSLDADGAVPPRPPNSEHLFADFALPRVRGVWKLDVASGGWESVRPHQAGRRMGIGVGVDARPCGRGMDCAFDANNQSSHGEARAHVLNVPSAPSPATPSHSGAFQINRSRNCWDGWDIGRTTAIRELRLSNRDHCFSNTCTLFTFWPCALIPVVVTVWVFPSRDSDARVVVVCFPFTFVTHSIV
jgi:hypothetical protein